MQVALSVQAGAVLPSMLLRRLGTQARKNALYRAFRELGRVVRTLFLLDYVTDLPLRRSIRAATTKVEAYNGFTEWVRFGGETLTTGDPVEQEKRVKYTDLVASAIMLQNVADMSDALGSLVAEGWAVTPGQVARLSPYGTARVKRFGGVRARHGRGASAARAPSARSDRGAGAAMMTFCTYPDAVGEFKTGPEG